MRIDIERPNGRVASPTELAEALTYITPGFTEEVFDSYYVSDHPVANDFGLAESYEKAAGLMPEPSEGKQGVALIVGNGGFETAVRFLPSETPIIICDMSASNLFTQRVILETIRNCPTVAGFQEAIEQFGEDFIGLRSKGTPEMPEFDSLDVRYEDQETRWNHGVIPYFLHSEQAYDAARNDLLQQAIGFREINLRDVEDRDALAADLTAQNAEVTLLNATNVFAVGWAGPDSGIGLATRLPFNTHAMVMDSNGGNLESQVHKIEAWKAYHNLRIKRAHMGQAMATLAIEGNP